MQRRRRRWLLKRWAKELYYAYSKTIVRKNSFFLNTIFPLQRNFVEKSMRLKVKNFVEKSQRLKVKNFVEKSLRHKVKTSLALTPFFKFFIFNNKPKGLSFLPDYDGHHLLWTKTLFLEHRLGAGSQWDPFRQGSSIPPARALRRQRYLLFSNLFYNLQKFTAFDQLQLSSPVKFFFQKKPRLSNALKCFLERYFPPKGLSSFYPKPPFMPLLYRQSFLKGYDPWVKLFILDKMLYFSFWGRFFFGRALMQCSGNFFIFE